MSRPARRSPLTWLGGLLALYLVVPLVAFAGRLLGGSDAGFAAPGLWPALGVSVEASTISLALVSALGIPLAFVLAHHRGRLARLTGLAVQLPLALPPLMSGILLVYLVGPYTFLGRISGQRLTETLAGVVIAQSFVAAPFLVVAARSAFATVDPALDDLAATLGHPPVARFVRVHLAAAAPGIRAGMVLSWLRAFGEYGATVILAYHPFSLPIYTSDRFAGYPLSSTEAPTLLALVTAAAAIAVGQLRRPHRRLGSGPAPTPPPVAEPVRVAFDVRASAGSFDLAVAHTAATHRLAVVGPSGSGKSLLLRSLAGLLGPDVGTVHYGGTDVSSVPTEHRGIGYVPQGLGLSPGRTVWQQATFATRAVPGRAAWWIDGLHLRPLVDRLPGELSGGQRQRVGLARALACDPRVVLLDEPFSALDVPVRRELVAELRRLQRDTGLSTVLVTHDPDEAAMLADELLVVVDGRLLQAGPSEEVLARPASPLVARLLGVDNVLDAMVVEGGVGLLGTGSDPPLTIDALTGLPVATPVTVRIDAAGLRLGTTDGHPAAVADAVALASGWRVDVRLLGGPTLRLHPPGDPGLRAGALTSVAVDPEAVSVWAGPVAVVAGV